MRILAFSDVSKWVGYDELVCNLRPDLIALAGDLTSDGFAAFWHEAVERIPEFQIEKKLLMNRLKVTQRSDGVFSGQDISRFLDELRSLKIGYRKTEDFQKIRKKLHVDKFYEFLENSGKTCPVLVVKGDHDEDFEEDYLLEKINEMPNCIELSGRIREIEGLCFLGLGFRETHYLAKLKSSIERFKNEADVIITHCEQRSMQFLRSNKLQLIIRGHFGSGRYLVNGIKSAFTNGGLYYSLIEIKNSSTIKIKQYVTDRNNGIRELEKGSCKPWFTQVSEYERYGWLKPYVE